MLTSEQMRKLPGYLAVAGSVALVLAIVGLWLDAPTRMVMQAQIGAVSAATFIALFPEALFRWFIVAMVAVNSLFAFVLH